MAKLGNLYLDGKFPISTNRLNHFDRLFGQALFGGVEKTIDFTPVISVSDALAKPAIDLQCKITAVQEGSGDPSPQNIRNIVGFSELSVFRTGVNLYNAENPTNGYISSSDGAKKASSTWKCSDSYSPVKGGTTYTLSKDGTGSSSSAGWACYDENYNRVGGGSYGSWTTTVITLPENARYFRASWRDTADNPIMLIPSGVTVPTDYIAYETPTEYPVTWQTEAGTIYGGILNFITGVLTVTHAIVTLTKDSTWQKGGSQTTGGFNRFYSSPVPTMKSGSGMLDGMCDKLPIGKISSLIPCVVLGYSNNNYIQVLSTANDVEDFKAELENTYGNSLSVVYPLATPQTYTLTPQAVQMLAGNNTLWNTAGDTKLTYLAKKG